jgi:hypothetical protein
MGKTKARQASPRFFSKKESRWDGRYRERQEKFKQVPHQDAEEHRHRCISLIPEDWQSNSLIWWEMLHSPSDVFLTSEDEASALNNWFSTLKAKELVTETPRVTFVRIFNSEEFFRRMRLRHKDVQDIVNDLCEKDTFPSPTEQKLLRRAQKKRQKNNVW